MSHALGDELWLVFYDALTNTNVARCVGKVTGLRGTTHAQAGGRWYAVSEWPPGFATEAEAVAWITENPRRTPTGAGDVTRIALMSVAVGGFVVGYRFRAGRFEPLAGCSLHDENHAAGR